MAGSAREARWLELYDAYRGQIDLIKAQLERYDDPAARIHQDLIINLLNTEHALYEHIRTGQNDPALMGLAQERLGSVVGSRQLSVNGFLYDNRGSSPIPDLSVPESARAQWFLEQIDSFTSTVGRVVEVYDAFADVLRPFVIEATRATGASFINSLPLIPTPGKIFGVPQSVNRETDALGQGITDILFGRSTGQKTPGEVLMDRILGPRPERDESDPIEQLFRGALLDDEIAERFGWFAQLEIDNGARSSYSADDGVLTLHTDWGGVGLEADFLIGSAGLDFVESRTLVDGVDVSEPVPTGEPIDNAFTLTTRTDDQTLSQIPGSLEGYETDLVNSGTVLGGPASIFECTYFNPTGLNFNTADNTADAAATRILVDMFMPAERNAAPEVFALDLIDFLVPAPGGADVYNAVVGNLLDLGATRAVPTDPLVLDLDGDGVHLTDYVSAPVLFDTDHDGGSRELTGWVSPQDGIVVLDLNGNGVIDDISETLSEYFNGTAGANGEAGSKPFAHGFAALASLDGNLDGTFDASDAAFAAVRVWVDANHDGQSWVDVNGNGSYEAGVDGSELKSLDELGIVSIGLANQVQSGEVRDGNEVLARGAFVQMVAGSPQTREALAANFLANGGFTFQVHHRGLFRGPPAGFGSRGTCAVDY